MSKLTVLGVDGWKSAWVGVVLIDGLFVDAVVGGDLPTLFARVPESVAVGIDVPIGFPTDAPRRADVAARLFVGRRRASVFPMLPEAAYRAGSHREASAMCRREWGKGVSQQAYALRHKVLELAELVVDDARVFEVHPEVTFREMAGYPVGWPKRSWNGQQLRRRLLADRGVVLPDEMGEAGVVPVDDVLDAAACAWTAHRMARGEAATLPPDPGIDEPVITY